MKFHYDKINVMNYDQLDDLKQFIDSLISQSEARTDQMFTKLSQKIDNVDSKLSQKIDDVDLKLDTITETLHAQNSDFKARVSKLEEKLA